MSEPLRLLLVEDSPVDAELNERELRKAGLAFVTTRVEEEAALVAALEDFRPDLILADYHLPGFDGLRALAICRERMPATPFIFVTGAMGEELAVESIKAGATDYILKDRLARLGPAARRALDERRTLVERTQAQRELSVSEERYHQLFEAMSSGVAIYRPDPVGESFTIQSVNRAVERIEGVARPDLLGRDVQAVFPGIESIGLLAALRRVARSGEPEQLPPTLYQDGRIRGWRQNYVYRLGTGDVVAVYEDVSERMEREAQIGRLNRTLRTITACDQDLVRMRCEDDLLQAICHDLVQVGQHLLVWVAYPDPDGPGGLRTLVTRGEPDLLRALGNLDSAAVQDGCGLARAALLQGRTLTWSGGIRFRTACHPGSWPPGWRPGWPCRWFTTARCWVSSRSCRGSPGHSMARKLPSWKTWPRTWPTVSWRSALPWNAIAIWARWARPCGARWPFSPGRRKCATPTPRVINSGWPPWRWPSPGT
jgi:CheY-like chemotaxis protein